MFMTENAQTQSNTHATVFRHERVLISHHRPRTTPPLSPATSVRLSSQTLCRVTERPRAQHLRLCSPSQAVTGRAWKNLRGNQSKTHGVRFPCSCPCALLKRRFAKRFCNDISVLSETAISRCAIAIRRDIAVRDRLPTSITLVLVPRCIAAAMSASSTRKTGENQAPCPFDYAFSTDPYPSAHLSAPHPHGLCTL